MNKKLEKLQAIILPCIKGGISMLRNSDNRVYTIRFVTLFIAHYIITLNVAFAQIYTNISIAHINDNTVVNEIHNISSMKISHMKKEKDLIVYGGVGKIYKTAQDLQQKNVTQYSDTTGVATPNIYKNVSKKLKQTTSFNSEKPVAQNRFPRFVTVKSSSVNLRSGPGVTYPIKFHIHCAGYPLEMIAEFENWRLVRDIYNNRGWIKASLITETHRGAVVVDKVSNIKNIMTGKIECVKNGDKNNGNCDKNKTSTKIKTIYTQQQKTTHMKDEYAIDFTQHQTHHINTIPSHGDNNTQKPLVLLREFPDQNATIIARVETGSIVQIVKCTRFGYCKVRLNDGDEKNKNIFIGWIKRSNLWGLYSDEKV